MTKRLCDVLIALITIPFFSIPFIFIWIAVRTTSPGPGIYWSKRIGQRGIIFMMPKFRTMLLKTPEVQTDKIFDPQNYLTPIGSFLRHTSLDETPQILCVLTGKMSVVGPRPALYNQYELIAKRKELGIESLRPGITGWAQINGRDQITLSQKIYLDLEYLKKQSFMFDLKIIIKTMKLVLKSKNVLH